MSTRLLVLSAAVAGSLTLPACYTSRPVVDTSAKPQAQEGTVAGLVTTDSKVPLEGRIVRAIPLEGGAEPYEVSTGNTGGYTIKVPPGRYRLEVVLRPGERLVTEPGETTIRRSDLDAGRNFVIATSAPRE